VSISFIVTLYYTGPGTWTDSYRKLKKIQRRIFGPKSEEIIGRGVTP
jgi:hypothetical protein